MLTFPCGCRLRAPFTPTRLCEEARRLLALCTDPPPLEGRAWEAFQAHFGGGGTGEGARGGVER